MIPSRLMTSQGKTLLGLMRQHHKYTTFLKTYEAPFFSSKGLRIRKSLVPHTVYNINNLNSSKHPKGATQLASGRRPAGNMRYPFPTTLVVAQTNASATTRVEYLTVPYPRQSSGYALRLGAI